MQDNNYKTAEFGVPVAANLSYKQVKYGFRDVRNWFHFLDIYLDNLV